MLTGPPTNGETVPPLEHLEEEEEDSEHHLRGR